MTGTVHVRRGRVQHLPQPGNPGRFWTLCGKTWVATIIGPPSNEKPMCKDCEAEA